MDWIKIFPEEEGLYWLYARVWSDEKPKLYPAEVLKISNGFLYTCKGQFLFEDDIEGDFYFRKMELPELPE